MLVRPYVVKPAVSPLGVPQIKTSSSSLSPSASPRPAVSPSPRVSASPERGGGGAAALSPRRATTSSSPSLSSSPSTPPLSPDAASSKTTFTSPCTRSSSSSSPSLPTPPIVLSKDKKTHHDDDDDVEGRRRRLETKLFDLLHGLDTRLRGVPSHAGFWRAIDAARDRFDRRWDDEARHTYHTFYSGLERRRRSPSSSPSSSSSSSSKEGDGIHDAFEELCAEVARQLSVSPTCRLHLPHDKRVRRECKLILALAALPT